MNDRSLFVKNLPKNSTDKLLKSLHPDIVNVRLRMHTKKKSCYAFLEFKDKKCAEKAYTTLKAKVVEGKTLYVDHCNTKSPKPGKANKQNLRMLSNWTN